MINWLLKISAIIALLSMLSIAWSQHSKYKQFNSVGISAKADLLGDVSEFTQKVRRIERTEYSVDLSFTTANGQLIKVHRVLPDKTLEAIQAGKPIEILYLPNDPEKTRFSQESDQSLSTALGGVLVSAMLYILGAWKTKEQE